MVLIYLLIALVQDEVLLIVASILVKGRTDTKGPYIKLANLNLGGTK